MSMRAAKASRTPEGIRPRVGAPTLQGAYAEYRGLLLWVLARVGERGYRVNLADALDLIHEFFATQYEGVTRNYRPEQARFSSYLAGAFRNFVIKTVLRAADHADRLARMAEMRGEAGDPGEPPEWDSDLTILKSGLERLPPDARRLLALRVGEGMTERAVGRELGLSRYGVRERTARALAHLAAEVGEPGVAEARDWPLVRMLTIEDRPIADAAEALGITQAQAQAAWRRTLARFSSVLSPTRRSEGGTSQMATTEKLDETRILDLLNQCAKGDVDAALYSEFERHADELEAYLLTDPDDDVVEEIKDPSILLRILGGAAHARQSVEDRAILDEMFERARRADDHVRDAVEACLLARLEPADKVKVCDLASPLQLYGAIDAVPTLLHRWAHLERLKFVVFVLEPDGTVCLDGEVRIAPETTLKEVRTRSGLEAGLAAPLLEWVCAAARRYEKLFVGAATKPSDGKSVVVQLTKRPDELDLMKYWGPAPPNESQITYSNETEGV